MIFVKAKVLIQASSFKGCGLSILCNFSLNTRRLYSLLFSRKTDLTEASLSDNMNVSTTKYIKGFKYLLFITDEFNLPDSTIRMNRRSLGLLLFKTHLIILAENLTRNNQMNVN